APEWAPGADVGSQRRWPEDRAGRGYCTAIPTSAAEHPPQLDHVVPGEPGQGPQVKGIAPWPSRLGCRQSVELNPLPVLDRGELPVAPLETGASQPRGLPRPRPATLDCR